MSRCFGSWKKCTSCIMSNKQGGQAGQSLVEFIIVIPLFFVILFGIFEFTFIYKAKATLNTATFEAARAGSLDHGRRPMMLDALAKGMAPLYMKGSDSAGVIGMSGAYARARGVATLIDVMPGLGAIDVISPTPEVVEQFSVKRAIQVEGEPGYRQATFIPSDNLYFRSSEDIVVQVNGEDVLMNIQDANLLKIQTLWCYRMITPLVSRLVRAVMSNPLMSSTSAEQQACNTASFVTGGNYLALRSHAVIRMQTHYLKEDS